MSKTKIKCCPYCGVAPQLEIINLTIPKYFWSCNNIKCPINPCTPSYRDKKSATRAWNKRYTKDIEVAIAEKIFADIEGQVVTKAIYQGEVIWESAIKINDLRKKYGLK